MQVVTHLKKKKEEKKKKKDNQYKLKKAMVIAIGLNTTPLSYTISHINLVISCLQKCLDVCRSESLCEAVELARQYDEDTYACIFVRDLVEDTR